MSWKRIWHWTCDDCGVEVQKESWGHPTGFSYIPGKYTMLHMIEPKTVCGDCTEKRKAAKKI